MEHNKMESGEERARRRKLEGKSEEISLSIEEEPEPDKDLDQGYYLDEDFDESILDEDFGGLDFEFEPEEPEPEASKPAAPEPREPKEERAGENVLEPEISGTESVKTAELRSRSRRQGTRWEERTPVPEPVPQPPVKKKTSTKGIRTAVCVLLAVLAAGTACYCAAAQKYKSVFYPNTRMNGLNAGGMTAEEVKEQMASAVDGYQIHIVGRNGSSAVVSGEEIGLHTVFDGTLEQMLEEQNPYLWGWYFFRGTESLVDTVLAYEEDSFFACVEELPILDPEQVIPYEEAHISDYISGTGYTMIPAEPGTEIEKERFTQVLSDAVLSMEEELSLEETGCYLHPLEEEPKTELTRLLDQLNQFVRTTVTYQFGSSREVLDGEEIHKWLSVGTDGTVTIDETMVSDYVAQLAKKYNTAYSKRKFQTSYGQEVEVSGFYGWRINQTAETEALTAIVSSGESQNREPEYSQKGASHDGNDYGNTYAEVNLTAQHMFFYKDGKKILESDFVSGNVSKGHTTPPGIFAITYKQKDAVLKGVGYATPVKFWMPFNGGIGFHDATWRNQFGGSIYKTNGSHGCINMPYSAAQTLFENVYAGMPVICYNLAGTESGKSSSASGSGGASEKPAETQAPATSAPAETQAPEASAAPEPTEASETPAAPVQPAETAAAAANGPGEESSAGGTVAGPGETESSGMPEGPGAAAGPGGTDAGTSTPVAEPTAAGESPDPGLSAGPGFVQP